MVPQKKCFQFKASFSPCLIFEVNDHELDMLTTEVSQVVKRTPHFFKGSPVIIDMEKIKSSAWMGIDQLKQLLSAEGMVPIGVRGGNEAQQNAALHVGLPKINIGKASSTEIVNQSVAPVVQTKMVTQPVRSGMQISSTGDLIVTAQVSSGAELLAEGHIHVYGPLRGRALAGIQGNKNARIFCRQLQAELVAIAGYYLTKEEMQSISVKDGLMQIYLDGEELRIQAM